jgi:hypothetical protein
MGTTGWDPKPFNEKRPFGRGATVVGGDNIEFSRVRREAIIAVKNGRATPEQRALVMETDAVIQECLEGREGEE